jgi:hypothetical protein
MRFMPVRASISIESTQIPPSNLRRRFITPNKQKQ